MASRITGWSPSRAVSAIRIAKGQVDAGVGHASAKTLLIASASERSSTDVNVSIAPGIALGATQSFARDGGLPAVAERRLVWLPQIPRARVSRRIAQFSIAWVRKSPPLTSELCE